MKLLQLCVAAAIAAGVTGCLHIARAQALGEAASLSAGVSTAGSASGSALGNSIGRAMRNDGRRTASSSKSRKSGVTNLHWSREELERSAKAARTQMRDDAKIAGGKDQPDFVIVGGDPQIAASGDAPVNQTKAAHPSASQPKPSKDDGSSGPGGKN